MTRSAPFLFALLCVCCCNRKDSAARAARDAAPPWPSVSVTPRPPPIVDASTSAADGGRSAPVTTGVGCAKINAPVEGMADTKIVDRPKPAKGDAHEEPSFHTCFVRATDHAKEGIDGFSRNDYSRRQAFNADSTRFLTSTLDGGWRLYDAQTLALVGPLKELSGDAEPQWHPTDPNILYYGMRDGGMQIKALDLRTGGSRVVIDLKGKLPWPTAARCWTKSEGSPSKDARYWPFQCETEKFDILGYAVWDMVADKLVGSTPIKSRPDHVSMSPSGKWFVSSGDETTAWSPDFSSHHKIRKGGEHSDLAIGLDGHDYYVSIDYDDSGWVYMLDLDTQDRTNLFKTYLNHAATAMHFSGKAFAKPGWVLISTYTGTGSPQWYTDKVMAVEMAKDPRVYQLAGNHSYVGGEYFAEPQASVNRDFTRILFNSNWGVKASKDIDAYMIILPGGI